MVCADSLSTLILPQPRSSFVSLRLVIKHLQMRYDVAQFLITSRDRIKQLYKQIHNQITLFFVSP